MLLDLVATLAAAFGCAGVALAARFLSRGRLPRWIVPMAAGLGMLLFAVWNEYTWFGRVTAQLPETVTVVSAPADRVAYRPWTYLAPVRTRLMALDRGAMLRSAADPALRVAPVLVMERWGPTRRLGVAFDCAGARRGDMTGGAAMGEDGTLTGVAWREVGGGDSLLEAACRED